MIGNNFVPPNNLRLRSFLYFILQIIKGKEVVIENGEEIYAKDSMKLQGVQLKSISVL